MPFAQGGRSVCEMRACPNVHVTNVQLPNVQLPNLQLELYSSGASSIGS
jgi:hypothetical protein